MFTATVSSATSFGGGGNRSCQMNVEPGWNLISLAEMGCMTMKIDARNDEIQNFPAYLDLYAYDGSEYIYARINKQDLKDHFGGNSSLSSAIEKYADKLARKVSSNQASNWNDFQRIAEGAIKQNDTLKIKEYAGRLVRESISSIWVYNPGRNFSVEYFPRNDDDESLVISGLHALFTDISSSELSQLTNYIESESLPTILRELEKEPGYLTFIKEISTGKVILDSGWSFLSYSRIVSDDNGNLNFNNGNCSISKAYVFDNDSKKWVSAGNASRSMIGSGIVVYNSGAKCNLAPENSIISKLKSMLKGGSSNVPPALPN